MKWRVHYVQDLLAILFIFLGVAVWKIAFSWWFGFLMEKSGLARKDFVNALLVLVVALNMLAIGNLILFVLTLMGLFICTVHEARMRMMTANKSESIYMRYITTDLTIGAYHAGFGFLAAVLALALTPFHNDGPWAALAFILYGLLSIVPFPQWEWEELISISVDGGK